MFQFRSEHLRAKRLETQGIKNSNGSSPPMRQQSGSYSKKHIPRGKGAAGNAASARRVEELPSLSSTLRPSRSTIQLEKRYSSGLSDADRLCSGSTTHSSTMASRKDSDRSSPDGNQEPSPVMRAVVDGVFIDDNMEDAADAGAGAKGGTRAGNSSASTSGEKTTSSKTEPAPLSRENSAYQRLRTADISIGLDNSNPIDDKVIERLTKDPSQSWRHSSAFIWEEMHDHIAGDLFYTSFERIKRLNHRKP